MRKVGLFTNFIYQVDENVDNILNQIMDNHELTEFVYNDEYTMNLRFGNKISAKLWNAERYYAWLSRGEIKVNGELFFTWSHARPKRKTMNRLLKLMDRFIEKRIKSLKNV